MDLLAQISKEDIKKVISYSQSIENPQIDNLLRTWAEKKKTLSQLFLNGQVTRTYPEPVQFDTDLKHKETRFNEYIDWVCYTLNKKDYSAIALVDFLRSMSTETFYTNILPEDYTIQSEDDKVIPKGSKIIKSFKYFIRNTELLTQIQDKASMLIQESKVEGYLTFSIHPLDFLSSSENIYHWRSCHSLDGEYRAGNLSYICDASTMIVYLSDGKGYKLPNFPEDVLWNSKKWRMLLYFNSKYNICFAGRQYPFVSLGGLERVNDIFKLINNYCYDWTNWKQNYLSTATTIDNKPVDIASMDGEYCVINHRIYDIHRIIKDTPNSQHFNDVLNSSIYHNPYYMYQLYAYYGTEADIEFNIGAEVPCLKCGNGSILGVDTMLCDNCVDEMDEEEEPTYCDCCGSRIYDLTEALLVEGELICADCANTEIFTCPICGMNYFNSSNCYWSDEHSAYICQHCFDEGEEENGSSWNDGKTECNTEN